MWKKVTSVVGQEMGGGGGGRVWGGGGGGGVEGGVGLGGVWGRLGWGGGEGLLSSMVGGGSWFSRFEVVGTGTGRRWVR